MNKYILRDLFIIFCLYFYNSPSMFCNFLHWIFWLKIALLRRRFFSIIVGMSGYSYLISILL